MKPQPTRPVNTVTGTIAPALLGSTLMHEHVFVQYGGAGGDAVRPGPVRDRIVSVCTGHARRIKAHGVQTVVDPTTADLGRNVSLMVEVASAAGINIICATGLYSTAAYTSTRARLGGGLEAVSDLFVREITDGVGETGIKAGIIKAVTGTPPISRDEHELLLAAGRASAATGVPVTTHTEGVLGDEQQRILGEAGVAPHNIVVGHSCIATSFDYHARIARAGSFVGFDRFGMEGGMPDEVRVDSMLKLIEAGFTSSLIVSHDSVWYWVGGPGPGAGPWKNWVPTNFFERIVPMLTCGGVTDDQIQTMLCDNPRRFFSDGPLPEGRLTI